MSWGWSRICRHSMRVNNPRWLAWAGLAAVVGGVLAILLTPPFASAYFAAYPGFEVPPFWIAWLRPALAPWLTFAPPITVYNLYGRVYEIVYLLFLPAAFGVHRLHRGTAGRAEKWGFAMVVVGLLTSFIGVAGDYWADGAGFVIELLGLLILSIGTAVYGVGLLRGGVVPRWCGWLLVSCLPAVFIIFPLIGHIPSGPTLPIAVAWLMVGSMLLLKKGRQPSS
jgi:hypothetical protein